MRHYSNTKNPVDFPQVLAGADLHSGDGGYSLGTKEAYDEFAKTRNKSLGKARIREMETECTTLHEFKTESGHTRRQLRFDKEKFAELIVRECASISDASFHSGSAGYLAILKHFGVE